MISGRVTRDEIVAFVKDRLGFEPTRETKFWWDTGVYGLDAMGFMLEFAEHFGVREGTGDDDLDYGDSEGGLGEVFWDLWRRITFRAVPRKHHFTIDHLVEVANRKQWFDP